MAYVAGEERIESVEDKQAVDAAFEALRRPGSWGSTRFDSHGYVSGLKERPAVVLDGIEIRVTENANGTFKARFRTKGSRGWHC